MSNPNLSSKSPILLTKIWKYRFPPENLLDFENSLGYITADEAAINKTTILLFKLKVQGETKLLAPGRCAKSRWLLCYSNFKVCHFFRIFQIFYSTWGAENLNRAIFCVDKHVE